jgi:hypothetical protein
MPNVVVDLFDHPTIFYYPFSPFIELPWTWFPLNKKHSPLGVITNSDQEVEQRFRHRCALAARDVRSVPGTAIN